MKPVKDDDTDRIFLQLKKELQKIGLENTEQEEDRRTTFTGQGFCMELPEGFAEIAPATASAAFYSRHRPETILVYPGKHAGFTFQELEPDEQLQGRSREETAETIRGILRRADEKCVFYDTGQEGNIPVLWFDYKSFAKDGAVYNMMFLFPAGEKLITGTFYCIFRDYDRWKPKLRKLFSTVLVKRGDMI